MYKETTKQDGLFNKSVNHLKQKIVFVLDDFDKRKVKTKQPYWTEENKQDIANVIVVMIFICCFLVFCFSITKISVGIFNILEKTREHDIIMEEELVSVDETERIYHFDNCPHIKDDMRYLKLEEPYAIQLGYERCNLYKKFGK